MGQHPDRPFEIEIGSGKGTFILNHAAANPGTNILGIEWVRLHSLRGRSRPCGAQQRADAQHGRDGVPQVADARRDRERGAPVFLGSLAEVTPSSPCVVRTCSWAGLPRACTRRRTAHCHRSRRILGVDGNALRPRRINGGMPGGSTLSSARPSILPSGSVKVRPSVPTTNARCAPSGRRTRACCASRSDRGSGSFGGAKVAFSTRKQGGFRDVLPRRPREFTSVMRCSD